MFCEEKLDSFIVNEAEGEFIGVVFTVMNEVNNMLVRADDIKFNIIDQVGCQLRNITC